MIIFVLGGTRSGKSLFGEQVASTSADGRPVTYFATAKVDPNDADHQARVDLHRKRRPSHWRTVECADQASLIEGLESQLNPGSVALIDSLGTWVACGYDDQSTQTPGQASSIPIKRLVNQLMALQRRQTTVVVVSEEVGLSVHPPSEAGRWFADQLGTVNRAVSEVADRAVLVVAGRPLELGPPL